jgi:histidine phosphotransferase ChpT
MARQRMDRFTPTTVFAGAADQASLSRRFSHAPVISTVDMRVLELLTARLCHELSAPIGAINNGAELLSEEDLDRGPGPAPATNFVHDAAAMIGDSARRAGRRLQFYRFAYGFGGGGALVGPTPRELAVGFFAESRVACDYSEDLWSLPPDWQKLACNLLPVGAEALPRGGRLVLTNDPLSLEAVGEAAALAPELRDALMMTIPVAELTSQTVQAFFSGLLAKTLGCRLIGTAEPGRVRLTAIAAGT